MKRRGVSKGVPAVWPALMAFGLTLAGPPRPALAADGGDFADRNALVAALKREAPDLARLAVPAEKNLFEPRHVRMTNGVISIGPAEGAAGVGAFFAPPVAADSFRFDLQADGETPNVTGGLWTPAFLVRTGTAGGLMVETILAPVGGERAFVLQAEFFNPQVETRTVEIAATMGGWIGQADGGEWRYGPPKGKFIGRVKFSQSRAAASLTNFSASAGVAFSEKNFRFEDGRFRVNWTLEPGERRKTAFVFAASEDETEAKKTAWTLLNAGVEAAFASSVEEWAGRWRRVEDTLPRFKSDNPALDLFYLRSLLSLPMSSWSAKGFLRDPWLATSGADGGAMCAYLWDASYLSQILPLYDPGAVPFLLRAYLNMGVDRHYAVTPYGEAVGPWYAYNAYGFVRLLYHYVALTGDAGVLSAPHEGRALLDWAKEVALEGQRLERPPTLKDYGTNENLLELKRTKYEGYVPSPNAERVWIHRAIAELIELQGGDGSAWRERADRLAWLVREQLWDRDAGWFQQMSARGARSLTHTIQTFDILRAGFLPREEARAMTRRLNEREFLSEFGAHSLSKTDPGYDPADADWGGPGVYAGDAPELAQDLYGAGFDREGDDVLRRILWWGENMPYVPQAVLAGERDYRRNGRANVNAGAVGAAAAIYGLFGVRIAPGGAVEIDPADTSLFQDATLDGLRIRGTAFRIERRGDRFTVSAAGARREGRVGTPLTFEFPNREIGEPETRPAR